MRRNGLSALLNELQRPDDALNIVGMDSSGGGGVPLLEHLVHHFRSLRVRDRREPLPQRRVLFHLGKIDVIEKRLDVKAGSAAQDGQFSGFCHSVNSLAGLLLKADHIPGLPGVHAVDQVMRYALHLFRRDLGAADVHAPIDLHGVGGDHFAVHAAGKFDSRRAFAGGSGTCDDQ